MHLGVIGSGYVGLVTGVCFADTGHFVVGVDVDEDKVERLNAGQNPIYEPGLSDLLQSNLQAGRIRFTTDLVEAMKGIDVVFLAVGTPATPDGSADLSLLEQVSGEVAAALKGDAILVIKSTVPVGTADRIEALIRKTCPHHVPVVNNPEFLKEGTAVDDFFRPDRVVIGCEDDQAGETIRQLYEPFVRNQKPILMMRRRAAEMTKYAANAYLAARISFINEIANICERMNVDVDEVRVGMGTDARIGMHFLYPGCGYGGSCFPKDVQALAAFAQQDGYQAQLISAVHAVNERQKAVLFDKLARRFDGRLQDKTIAIWGVAFKARTDDIREAPALRVIDRLLQAKAHVRVHDPQALDNLRRQYGDRLQYGTDAYDIIEGADALVVLTEWNEFRSPDWPRLKDLMKQPIIFDGRNLYNPQLLAKIGFEHFPIGKPPVTEQAASD